MLELFINYIVIGFVFTFVVDIASDYAKKKGIEIPKESEWNMETRLMAVWIWPIGVIFFLNGFFKEYFNNKNNRDER
jgi:uncharacterized membrane protein